MLSAPLLFIRQVDYRMLWKPCRSFFFSIVMTFKFTHNYWCFSTAPVFGEKTVNALNIPLYTTKTTPYQDKIAYADTNYQQRRSVSRPFAQDMICRNVRVLTYTYVVIHWRMSTPFKIAEYDVSLFPYTHTLRAFSVENHA